MAELDLLEIANRKLTLSVRRLADVFEVARETVSRRLMEYDVQADGERNGHPVYPIRAAAEAILGFGITGPDGVRDPSLLPPEKRNAWYQSELRRIDVEMTTGKLVPAAEVETQMAEQTKGLVQFLETLPDQLERDVGLNPEQVVAMHESIDKHRQEFYETIVSEFEAETSPADSA